MKACKTCGDEKKDIEFPFRYKDTKGIKHRGNFCKECLNEQKRYRYKLSMEGIKEYRYNWEIQLINSIYKLKGRRNNKTYHEACEDILDIFIGGDAEVNKE